MSSIESENACPVTLCIKAIGGKWKPIIIYRIARGVNRFGALLRSIEGINKQMLSRQLRELEADGFLNRKVYPQIPPKVEYSISEKGESLYPVINNMRIWGERQVEPRRERPD